MYICLCIKILDANVDFFVRTEEASHGHTAAHRDVKGPK